MIEDEEMTDDADARSETEGDRLRALEALLNIASDSILRIGLDGRVRYANRAPSGSAACPTEGTAIATWLPAEARESVLAAISQVQKSRTAVAMTVPFPTLTGGLRHMPARITPLLVGGELIGTAMTIRDTASDIDDGAALRNTKQHLQTALEGADFGLWDLDVETEALTFNDRFATMLGYEPPNMAQSKGDFAALLHPEDRKAALAALDSHLAGATPRYESEYRMLGENGEYHWILSRAKVVSRTIEGLPVRVAGTHLDITERRQSETARLKLAEQLQRAQRIESVGQLAGGIAHDFNNILQALLGHAMFAARKLESGHPAAVDLNHIRRAANRAAELTQQLLTFSAREPLDPTAVDVDRCIGRFLRLVRRLLPKSIDLVHESGATELTAWGDPGRIEQVLMNLCLNARDAIDSAGTITITSSVAEISDDIATRHPGVKAGSYICIGVTDTGAGMPPEVAERMFEPFFTTKGQGGSGLGLSVVHGIVEQHNGYIEVQSSPDVGTTFSVYLQQSDIDDDETSGTHPFSPSIATGETILLAEDDAMVRPVLVAILTDAGYKVIAASDGKAALELYEEHKDEISAVILDAIMPRTNGRQAYDELRRRNPDIAAMFISGYSANTLLPDLPEGGPPLLRKPVHREDLLRTLRSVIDRE